ncbi:MAG: hypothetical protein PHV11_08305 [Candidatus Bipolaricaulis sp.]|jgi:hypothetical protein|nr:hypothetical protein [Candidatus Bipolaricaulis sp.]
MVKMSAEKRAQIAMAELDVREQDVTVAIARQRERCAVLETRREEIRKDRASLYVKYVSAPDAKK